MAELNESPRKWRVVSARAYYWGKKIMKPGQVFVAFEKDLPAEFKPMVVALDGLPDAPPMIPKVEPPKVEQPVFRVTYRKRERNGGEYYDIMDSRGKKVNEKNLTEEEADNMLKSLQA